MKRSDVNALIAEALDFFEAHRWYLPPFAHWSPEAWKEKGPEVAEIVEGTLGWDITDFGRGDYLDYGLLLFTMRNGRPGEQDSAKSYCEKIMIVKENQKTPRHHHRFKVEDIINRGGGNLLIQLWNTGDTVEQPVRASMDGVVREIPAGGTVTLTPGESITLPAWLDHEFWGEEGQGMVLVGEVSKVNDDASDNYFFDRTGRFPELEEDEQPLRLLVSDYTTWYHS